MPPAANLRAAANASFLNCSNQFAVGALKTALADFVTQGIVDFPDTVANNRPVGNWFVPIQSLSTSMNASLAFTLSQLDEAANLVFRICMAGDAIQTAGLITAPQAAALLAAYNANIV